MRRVREQFAELGIDFIHGRHVRRRRHDARVGRSHAAGFLRSVGHGRQVRQIGLQPPHALEILGAGLLSRPLGRVGRLIRRG